LERNLGILQLNSFLLTSCQICDLPSMPHRSKGSCTFWPHGPAPRLKHAPTSTGLGGQKHIPIRMKSKAKRQCNDKTNVSTTRHPHKIHNTFTATRTPIQHRVLTQGSSHTGSLEPPSYVGDWHFTPAPQAATPLTATVSPHNLPGVRPRAMPRTALPQRRHLDTTMCH
jgi:hypothetical protein